MCSEIWNVIVKLGSAIYFVPLDFPKKSLAHTAIIDSYPLPAGRREF